MTQLRRRQKESVIRETLARVPASTGAVGPAGPPGPPGAPGGVTSYNGRVGVVVPVAGDAAIDIAAHVALPDPHTQYALDTDKGAAGGIATLDGATKVPIAQIPTGATGSTVPFGNDARFSDARTPTAHKVSHQSGGTDEINVGGLAGVLANPQPPIIGGGAAQAVAGNDARLTDARTPTAHKVSHQDGGTDEISVLGLSGLLADPQHPIIGAAGTEAVAGNDARLTDARTPTSHVLATNAALGAQHTISGAAAGQVLRASSAVAANFQALVEGDITNLTSDLAAKEATANKGAASGYASLDGTTKVPIAQIPTGATGTTVPFGNDSRFSDARTPLAHAASHAAGGGDPVTLTEAQITNLVADLAARALLGVLAGSYDPGSVAMLNAQFLLQYKRLTLSGAERLTVPGTSNALLLDLGTTGARVVGFPKTLDGPFTIPHENFFEQRKRISLCCAARGTLLGTANLIIGDDFGSRSRIALAGVG